MSKKKKKLKKPQAITALNESIERPSSESQKIGKKIGAATALSEEQGKKGLEEALQMLENQRMDVSDRRREMETAGKSDLKKP